MSKVSRRQALGLLAVAGGGTVAAAKLSGTDLIPWQSVGLGEHLPEAGAEILVARKDDGLLLMLSLVNLEVRRTSLGSGPKLVLQNAASTGYVALTLREQSVFEQTTFDEGTLPTPTPTPPVPTLMSGPSRLVMKVVPGSAPVDFDLTAMMALPLSVSAIAKSGSATLPTEGPADTETAIEAPFRLVLSPGEGTGFAAAKAPVTRNGRTELWHARAVQRDAIGPQPVPVRAIWSPDLPGGTPLTEPWALNNGTASLLPPERVALVAATTMDRPAEADLLLVSPMGASLNIRGDWDRLDITAWRHKSWLGRDNYVKIDIPGFLFPFGFPAVKVKITERVHGAGLAYLRKQEFIIVRRPTMTYGKTVPTQPDAGRHLPFLAAETTTIVSPPLKLVRESIGAGEWVQIADADGNAAFLRYKIILTSHGGYRISADLPMVFIPSGAGAFDPDALGTTVDLYNAAPEPRRTMAFGGQRLAFVPSLHESDPTSPHPNEDPALPVFDFLVGAHVANASTATANALAAYPRMANALVRLEALDAIGGKQDQHTKIELHSTYLQKDFGGVDNAGEVWAHVPKPPKLEVPQQTGGGLAAPALDVAGLSRAHGPIADVMSIAKGDFNPKSYFPVDTITLLGGIPLNKVLSLVPTIPDPRAPEGDNVPKVVTVRTAQAIDTTVTWKPKLQKALNGLFDPSANPPDDRLELKAVFHTDLGTGATTTVVTGDMRNFTLNFVDAGTLGFIQQQVVRLHFESRNGAKPTVDIQLGASKFLGDLQFLDDLKSYLPALPGGIKVDASPRGVNASLTIAVPAIQLGVLLIQNLTVGIILDLPFNGDQAILTFSFATREHPFQVTVSALGGGGFLAIGLGTRGVQQIEGSLEFGAAVAINLGVASGSVSIMAGIYFKYAQRQLGDGKPDGATGNTLVITGFVRAIGKLDVLGLIHITVELYLGLTYKKVTGQQGRVEGVATLSVRVEVFLFSTSVEVTMRKEFGAGPDPSFGQQITSGDWAKYCAAFAA